MQFLGYWHWQMPIIFVLSIWTRKEYDLALFFFLFELPPPTPHPPLKCEQKWHYNISTFCKHLCSQNKKYFGWNECYFFKLKFKWLSVEVKCQLQPFTTANIIINLTKRKLNEYFIIYQNEDEKTRQQIHKKLKFQDEQEMCILLTTNKSQSYKRGVVLRKR